MNGDGELERLLDVLVDRGIEHPGRFCHDLSVEAIDATIRWWDREIARKPDLHVGILVNTLKAGGRPVEAPRAKHDDSARRAAFERFIAAFPVDAVVERHFDTQALMYPDEDRCPGSMIVVGWSYPFVALECDVCGFGCAIGISPPGSPTRRGVPPPQQRTPQIVGYKIREKLRPTYVEAE